MTAPAADAGADPAADPAANPAADAGADPAADAGADPAAEAGDDASADAFAAIARSIADGAPEGWQKATLSGTISGTWTYYSGPQYHPEDVGYRDDPLEGLHDQFRGLHHALDAIDAFLLDLVVHASGEYEAISSESLEDLEPGYLYALDAYDLPAEPGELQSGRAYAVPAGDPDTAIELLHQYVAHVERILDHQPGALMSKLPDPVEADVEVELPPDLLALYTVVDGDGGAGIFDHYGWFGLEAIAEPVTDRWWGERNWKTEVSEPGLLDCVPAHAVRRAIDRTGWIPFATDTFGNFLAVDMDPGPQGRPGQVIRIGKDYQTGPEYVADSVTTLLRLHIEAMERGDYKAADGNIRIHWRAADENDPRLLEVNGLAAPLRGVHGGIQDLRVMNAFQVDLEPVRGLPALWHVALTNCASADLAPLQDVPVEELSVGLDLVDLTPLTGHATLRRLKVRSPQPVDLTPLRSLQALQSLDLSQAVVQDYSVLSELSGLKYLGLRPDQWQQFTPPPNLAAAGLLGTSSLAEAVDWVTPLGEDSTDPARHFGRYQLS